MKNNKLTKLGRHFALKQTLFMVCIVLFITLIVYIFFGYTYAKSVFMGGCVSIIPNIIFAYKTFQYAGALSSKKVIESFYSGIKLKMLYSALFFALVFKFLDIEPVVFFTTYSVVVFLPLFTSVFFIKH